MDDAFSPSKVAASRQKPPTLEREAPASRRSSRALWLALGWLFTGLGFAGTVLPLLPTTPLMLLAAYAFSRSSPRLHAWLLQHRTFGPFIRDWRAGLGIPLRAKVSTVALITLSLGSSIVLFISTPWTQWLLAAIGLSVSTYILTRPTKRAPASTASAPARRSQVAPLDRA
jgi:uncharacterized membrane protein YbaN (DUF454 family)